MLPALVSAGLHPEAWIASTFTFPGHGSLMCANGQLSVAGPVLQGRIEHVAFPMQASATLL
jgi:hypothetical protein